MPWHNAAQAQPPRPATPVPGGESVRLAALHAAWKRDRQVARRRLWWRWTLWGVQRYTLPVAAGLSLIAGMWFAVSAAVGWVEAPRRANQPVASVPAKPSPPTATLDTSSTMAGGPALPSKPLPPMTVSTPAGLVLAFEIGLPEPSAQTQRSPQSPVSSPALSDAAKIPNPQLISENWLHSKEP
jgi:hypothetical protein